jgi:hypothetical protein
MGSAPRALSANEIPICRRGTPLAGLEVIPVHTQTHRAPSIEPFEAGCAKHPVETFGFGLTLYGG